MGVRSGMTHAGLRAALALMLCGSAVGFHVASGQGRLSPKAQPYGYAPHGPDDIRPWARYCVATARRRAARRGR